MKSLLRASLFISSIFILFSCSNNIGQADNISVDMSSDTLAQVNCDSLILTMTKQVLTSIKNNDYAKVADFFHPTLGVRFSPYAYIDTIHDLKFTRVEFLNESKAQKKFNWGSYDGSGDTILLTVAEYFHQFVYSADFLNSEKTSVNKIIKMGNSRNNIEEVYRDCDYSESYFSGFDKKFDGMDWCSLRMVFKNYKSKYYLIGIVHDQWTI